MEHNPNLKLHIEEDDPQLSLEKRLDEGLPVAKKLAQQFSALTGWVLDYTPSDKARNSYSPDSPIPVFGQFETIDLAPDVPANQTALHRGQCDELLQSINHIVQRLEAAELALWQHQHYASDSEHAYLDLQFPSKDSDILANMLKQAAQTLGATGAALYLLDDETTQLNLRATIGPVSAARQMQSTRPLEQALADLEALVGNVVSITDPMIGESWKIPDPYQFGICVMLGEPGLPLGTVWVFFDTAREASQSELKLLEDLSERIAAELRSRNPETQSPAESAMDHELKMTAKLNDCRLPSYPPEIDGWQVAGWTYRQDVLAGVFHEWSVTPSGQLSVAVGQVAGPMIPATINANNLRSLICAHREYRHSARKMVDKLNENVWTNSPGDDLAALIYVLIDPETQQVQAVNAGDGGMVFGNQQEVYSIDQFQNPLGADLDLSFEQWEYAFEESDTLILFSQGLRNALSESMNAVNDADLFTELLRDHAGQPQAILSEIEDRFYQSDFQHVAGDLSVIVLTRNSAPEEYSLAAAEEWKTIEAELASGDTDLLSALEDEIAALERLGFIRPDRNVIEPGGIEVDADELFGPSEESPRERSEPTPKKPHEAVPDSRSVPTEDLGETPPKVPTELPDETPKTPSSEEENPTAPDQPRPTPKRRPRKATQKRKAAKPKPEKTARRKTVKAKSASPKPTRKSTSKTAKKRTAKSKSADTAKPAAKKSPKKATHKTSKSSNRKTSSRKTVSAKKTSRKKDSSTNSAGSKTTTRKPKKKTTTSSRASAKRSVKVGAKTTKKSTSRPKRKTSSASKASRKKGSS